MKYLTLSLLVVGSSLTAKAEWLPREVHEVRAYVYDYTQEGRNWRNWSLLKEGKLHKGVINVEGEKLSKEQVERLMKALNAKKDSKPAKCHWPHHGFVFYDKEGVAMGHVQLCFQCSTLESSPKGAPIDGLDWKAMADLFKELGIPILKNDKDYTKLYLERIAKEQAALRH